MDEGATLTLVDGVGVTIVDDLGLDQDTILVIHIVIDKEERVYGIDFLQALQLVHLVFKSPVPVPLVYLLISERHHYLTVVSVVLHVNQWNFNGIAEGVLYLKFYDVNLVVIQDTLVGIGNHILHILIQLLDLPLDNICLGVHNLIDSTSESSSFITPVTVCHQRFSRLRIHLVITQFLPDDLVEFLHIGIGVGQDPEVVRILLETTYVGVYHIQDFIHILVVDVPDTLSILIDIGLICESITSPDGRGFVKNRIVVSPHHLCQFHYPVVCVPEHNGDVILIHRRELG